MLKKINLSLAVIILLSVFSLQAFSQSTDKPVKQKKTPEQKAERYAKKMQEKLALTNDQYNSVYNVFLDGMKQRESLKGMDKEARRTEMKKIMDNGKAQMKTILSADQFSKLETWHKEKMEKRKDGKGKKNKGNKDSKKQKRESK